MKRLGPMIAALCVVALAATGCATRDSRSGRLASHGWETLIDGDSGLNNFRKLGEANWREADGSVMADKGGKEPSYLVTRTSYTDFILYAEFWVNDDANSGIFIRMSDRDKVTADNSYEVNIYDKRPDPSYGTGAIVNFAKVSPMPKAGGKWNNFEITAHGSRVTVKMNGVQTVSMNDRSFFHGPFSLQYGSGVVKFRKVQIKPLPANLQPNSPYFTEQKPDGPKPSLD